jgi:phosphoribosylaminoimidazolecarboxamide formyltransferase/IMP cyclohydrolase
LAAGEISRQYRRVLREEFPERLELKLGEGSEAVSLVYRKVSWEVNGERKGLRYGENPHQPAALYRLEAGNLQLGEARLVSPDEPLCSTAELLQAGKHPGAINILDVDSALSILKRLPEACYCAVMKHNNPAGIARGSTPAESFDRAFFADPVAAFGGAVIFNRTVDRETAEELVSRYCEVVAAPDYEGEALTALSGKKNLRVLRIARMDRLREYEMRPYLDLASLNDGGLILQHSFVSSIRSASDFLPAESTHRGTRYAVDRTPDPAEGEDLLFAWQVCAGVTSNSVVFAKNGVSIGIGTGEQDRVGCARIARDKAYEKGRQRAAWREYNTAYDVLQPEEQERVDRMNEEEHGGLEGAVMASDGFFPFRDGVDVGLSEGVRAVIQPGGSLRDWESITACNEAGAAMVFTGERCFRH